ncbi:MAG: phosphoribosylamine--glycine ligase [Armatimonadota bacterium]|nr:phosphoribosylamine--glycine ligase [Armatimonadota bacterium]MDR7452472.1 phosphoribosylamine--glycine ligase [Armatimonadota bacterium]MDR7467324.1 phosphoribosylamine--glycine ligase [Armatimonadota bacterium]MDR7494095.1 phosphoribosylamine--glycine ligase [Armatimonadota bacterium]MDR7498938.1 phosphoribosylamine--glycine ligase [Armatimonadota bacterium]
MRALVVGSGGREHVLAWKLTRDEASCNLHAAPGNPGIALLGTCHAVAATDIPALAALAEDLRADLTVVGPEAPLADGIVDAFRARGLRIFGPTQAAARLESSKAFTKILLRARRIPTANFQIFTTPVEALTYIRRQNRPLVVKADGLAAGKGVVVAEDPRQAEQAVLDLMVRRVHGDAGRRIVIEDRLEGPEVSVLAFVHGRRVYPLLPARDYKRALDGDRGPNTGGMGALAPARAPLADLAQVVDEILEPVASAMVDAGCPYTGVLYAGLMLTADGPQVLEFNCRFGDPEAQVILPLLEGPLAEAMIATMDGGVPDLRWWDGAAVCVVAASGGYPGSFGTGFPIHGLEAVPQDVLVFHAGTAVRDGRIVTAGGRVLNVVGTGASLAQARAKAYDGLARIAFDGMQFRTDIGAAVEPAREGVSV